MKPPKPPAPRPVTLWVDEGSYVIAKAHKSVDGHYKDLGWRRVRYVPSSRGTAVALKVAVGWLRKIADPRYQGNDRAIELANRALARIRRLAGKG